MNNVIYHSQRALDSIGISPDEQKSILRIVASVLKLSNLSFSPVNNIDGSEGCAIQNEYGKPLTKYFLFVIASYPRCSVL